MALARDLRQIGFNSRQADFLGHVFVTSLAGAGTTQGAAAAITGTINLITTITAGVNDALILPSAALYKPTFLIVRNDSGATAQIFPFNGQNIQPYGTNVAINLATNTALTLVKINTTQFLLT